jgi:DNA-binding transcriptional regulator GbsR (MarR family)
MKCVKIKTEKEGRVPERDEDGVRRYVEHMSMMLAEWGFPRMAARVMMLLTGAEEEALTAGELAERLGVSPAAISGAVRYLIRLGIVDRVPVPGSRRDLYRLQDHAWYEMTLREQVLLKAIVEASEVGAEAAGGSATMAGARLTEMRDYFLFIQKELPTLLEKWRTSRSNPGDTGNHGSS